MLWQRSAWPLIIVCLFVSKVWQIRVWVLEENEIWGEWCLGTNQLSTVMSLHWSEAAALVKNTIIQSSFVIRSINFEMVYWMMLWTFSICAGNWEWSCEKNSCLKRYVGARPDQMFCCESVNCVVCKENNSFLHWNRDLLADLVSSDQMMSSGNIESRSKYQNVSSVTQGSQ